MDRVVTFHGHLSCEEVRRLEDQLNIQITKTGVLEAIAMWHVARAAGLGLMIGGMVGMGWHLWVGAFLIFLPGIIGMVFPELPSVKWIHELIPGGIGALAFATLISSWSGQLVNALLGKSELYGQLSFILIPLPVILISIIGMFAKQEDKLWQRTGKKWVAIAGGIAVFVFTIQVTDFIPTIFG